MMSMIEASYSGANFSIISVCGGGDDNQMACPLVGKSTKKAMEQYDNIHYVEIPDGYITNKDYGCILHRNQTGQHKIAAYLATPIKNIMGW